MVWQDLGIIDSTSVNRIPGMALLLMLLSQMSYEPGSGCCDAAVGAALDPGSEMAWLLG